MERQLAKSLFEKERLERVSLNKEKEMQKYEAALKKWEAKYEKPLAEDPLKE